MTEPFKTMIGLEIHVQLNTQSKMFCGCSNKADGKEPNELICPICMGMPGTLPVANIEAIRKTIATGLALKCQVAAFSKFDRKHYFYPDLPKGYQISQYDKPLCTGGTVEIGGQMVRLNRIHLEEDAGKLVHPVGKNYSVVDLNRAGTPLMEIVTEPDLTLPSQAADFLRKLQKIVKAIGVSDADMEKGHLRCDANISVNKSGKSSPIVEIKNLNSFKYVEKALLLEQKRLISESESWPAASTKLTRGFNSVKGETYSLREKEEAKDYRYFPEPDLPPIIVSDDPRLDVSKIVLNLPDLPDEIRSQMVSRGVRESEVEILLKNPDLYKIFSVCADSESLDLSAIAKFIVNNKKARQLGPDDIVAAVDLQDKKQVPSNILNQVIEKSLDEKISIAKSFEFFSNLSVDLNKILDRVIEENPEAVAKYRGGKVEVGAFLVGQAMKLAKGQANPSDIKNLLRKKLEITEEYER
jgi:aspartyl-tRNA(Asn)/glutamyl-tRNA(Gln) amidotransferase subunit B